MNRHVQWMREAYGMPDGERPPGLNSTLLLSEQQEFADSADSLGLQLADMLAAILRRALNDRLQFPGWKNFGRLLIADKTTPFLQFGVPDGRSRAMRGQVEKVWPALKTGNKPMLLPRNCASDIAAPLGATPKSAPYRAKDAGRFGSCA